MRSVSRYIVVGVVVVGGVLACSGSPAVPQAIIASNVNPVGMCAGEGEFLWIPQSPNGPLGIGPDTSDSAIIVPTATGDTVISCSVVPSAGGGSPYTVQLVAQLTAGSEPTQGGGTMTISGVFPQRSRATDGGTPNMDSMMIPNITVDFLDATKHLRQTNCYAIYEIIDADGTPGAALPSVADTFADNNGGRVWASVVCGTPTNLDEMEKPGNSGCLTYATFRFENCSSTANN